MIKIFFAKAVAVSAPAQTSVPSPKKNFRFDPFTPTPLYRLGYLSSVIEVNVVFVSLLNFTFTAISFRTLKSKNFKNYL
jgi:hypothetical protein